MARDGRGWHGDEKGHREAALKGQAEGANNTPMVTSKGEKFIKILTKASDDALKIASIKVLILQNLNETTTFKKEQIKSKIDSKKNEFYQPTNEDMRSLGNFKIFINKLSRKILKELGD